MKQIVAATVSLLISVSSACALSKSTGRGDDNYGTNAAAGTNASSANTDACANQVGKVKAKKTTLNRHAANQPTPGNSGAETAGAAEQYDAPRGCGQHRSVKR